MLPSRNASKRCPVDSISWIQASNLPPHPYRHDSPPFYTMLIDSGYEYPRIPLGGEINNSDRILRGNDLKPLPVYFIACYLNKETGFGASPRNTA